MLLAAVENWSCVTQVKPVTERSTSPHLYPLSHYVELVQNSTLLLIHSLLAVVDWSNTCRLMSARADCVAIFRNISGSTELHTVR